MELSLFKDELTYMYLFRVIGLSDICRIIIRIKNKSEAKETIDYHINLWENVAGSYFKSIENRYPTYSYVSRTSRRGTRYIAYPDSKLDYYRQTGNSYQVRDIILDQIKGYRSDIAEAWFYTEDKEFGKLTKKIMKKMNKDSPIYGLIKYFQSFF